MATLYDLFNVYKLALKLLVRLEAHEKSPLTEEANELLRAVQPGTFERDKAASG